MRETALLILAVGLWAGGAACGFMRESGTPPETAPDAAGESWRKLSPGAEEMEGVAWSGSRFVAVGWGAHASPDGLDWTKLDVPSDWRLTGVTWAGSRFVVFGRSVPSRRPILATSADGSAWQERVSPRASSGAGVRDVAWSGSLFVAVGSSSILTSPDLSVWTEQQAPADATLESIVWAGGRFAAVGRGASREAGIVLTSPDGVDWSRRDVGGGALLDVAWSGDRLVAVGYGILTSPDGISWTAQQVPGRHRLEAVAWGAGRFVAVGLQVDAPDRTGVILTSPDGASWTRRAAAERGDLLDVAWSGSRFVAVGRQHRGWFAGYTSSLFMASP